MFNVGIQNLLLGESKSTRYNNPQKNYRYGKSSKELSFENISVCGATMYDFMNYTAFAKSSQRNPRNILWNYYWNTVWNFQVVAIGWPKPHFYNYKLRTFFAPPRCQSLGLSSIFFKNMDHLNRFTCHFQNKYNYTI